MGNYSHQLDEHTNPSAAAIGNLFRYTSVSNALLVVAATVSTWVVLSSVWQYYRLRHFDGPFLAKISNLWLLTSVGGGRSYLDFWEVTQTYGTIARVGLNDLVSDDPALMKYIHGVKTSYRRSSWYDGMRFNPTANNCLSTRDENEHFKLRSKMAAGYSGRDVDYLEPKIDRNILALVKLLDKYAEQGANIDFGRKAQYFTLDAISDIAYGAPFGFLEMDSDIYKYIETTEKTLPMAMLVTVWPWLIKVLTAPLLKRFLPSATDRLGFGRVMGIAKEVAAERFRPDAKPEKDMLGSFIRHGLTQKEAESEILLQIAAGSDTTASAIRVVMLQVCTNRHILKKLRDEIASAVISGEIISDSEAKKLPYLQAIIKEGLRIFPPIAALMSKEVPPGGDTWNGVFIPGGTRLGYSIWAFVRREDIWGPDSREFRPERWLNAPPEKLRTMENTLDLVFSYGRWQCLGRPIALIELNKIFVELIRRFDMTLCDPTTPWKSFNCGVFAQSEIWMHIERTSWN